MFFFKKRKKKEKEKLYLDIELEERSEPATGKELKEYELIEQMQYVQEFLDWINEQGENENFPDFGKKCIVQRMRTPDGVDYPMPAGIYEGTALYSFPFEILYLEKE